jgi:NAD(P)-dependent dehydrogenase (short-subunit alcohol dehydrogenase family)
MISAARPFASTSSRPVWCERHYGRIWPKRIAGRSINRRRNGCGHVGDATEIAEACLYLMRQSYSTGQVHVVDGGAVLV